MKAMIFAAGLGTRLKPLTDRCPKALITVAGKPMLEHVILKLKAAGFNEIVINVHHFANQILAFLEANDNFGVTIHISDETDELLDTGGGLQKAEKYLAINPEDFATMCQMQTIQYDDKIENLNEMVKSLRKEVNKHCILLHNVDIISNCCLEFLSFYHQRNPFAYATLLVSKRPTSRYLLFDDDNLLCGWINKDTKEVKPAGFHYEEGKYKEYAYSGIQMISPYLLNGTMPSGKYSIIDFYLNICKDVEIQCLLVKNLKLMDIGKPETLAEAEEFLSKI
ncbi:sugar phosphate nucleotidyltransferase [Phocaeicola sp.]